MSAAIHFPSPILDHKEFIEWMRGQPAPLDRFAKELESVMEQAEWYDELFSTVDTLFAKTEIDAPKDPNDPADARLRLVFDRYEAVRGMLHEWHDIDISEADYAERVEAFGNKSSADDDLVYRVRRGLTRLGVLQETDSNLYAAQMLSALLGVEFGT